jgi:2-methylcitrate dehydratase
MGYPSALSAERWGFYDALFGGESFSLPRSFGSYVMENILFKISFPAEFHAQTAVEAAFELHPEVRDRLEEVERVEISTQEPAVRIIDKTGPLHNAADRDHCLQYMTAVGLIFGELTADHYEDETARDPRVDSLREKMEVVEDERYSRDYLDPQKRSIANAVRVSFGDGTATEKVEVEYPIGHRRRRNEGIPLLERKFGANLRTRLPAWRARKVEELLLDQERLESAPVHRFMGMLSV